MTDYRDPKTGKRTAILRPEDPKKSLERLAEWNALMDHADDRSTNTIRIEALDEANALWITMKREQGWRFIGWLADDAKTTSTGESAAPGDLHINELEFEQDWR